MKQPIFILSSLLCVCGAQYAVASDYLEEEPIEVVEVADVDNVQLSEDEYIRENVDEIADVQPCVDEPLLPQESVQNLWTDDAVISNSASIQAVMLKPMQTKVHKPAKPKFALGEQSYYGETVYIINNFLSGNGDNVSATDGMYNGVKMRGTYENCPFNTPTECAIWARKPIISESVAPRSKTLRDGIMCEITSAIEENPNITADAKSMAPLMNRYRVLMRASQSCCTGGLTYQMHKAGATQKMIYRFLSDDANFSGFTSRCLVMPDSQIENTEKYDITTATVADVRNGCLCKSKANFKALLAPFEQLYKEYPEFADAPFEYRHYDGAGRAVVDSVNIDVQNVLHQLEMCP